MHDLLDLITQRSVYIALAVAGAVLATAGNVMLKKTDTWIAKPGRYLIKFGYVFAWSSVAMFVIAGFRNSGG